MRDYDIKAVIPGNAKSAGGDIEYTGGTIVAVGGMPNGKGLTLSTKSSSTLALQGYAVRYGKPHTYNGGIDVFVKGCFDKSLASRRRIGVWLDHKVDAQLASTDDNLELMSDDTGLAFRLKRPLDVLVDAVKSRKLTAMSPSYRVVRQEYKSVADEQVRMILEADLEEISVVKAGAVKQAFVDVVDTKSSLRDDVRAGRVLVDGSFVALIRAIDGLK